MTRRELLKFGTFSAGMAPVALGSSPARASSYDKYSAALRKPLAPDGGTEDIIRFATLAPNGHNTQSWLFSVSDARIDVRPDLRRRTPVVDPDDHHIYVSLGCAAENLALAAAATGCPGQVEIEDNGSLSYVWKRGPITRSPLVDVIPSRQSTRSIFGGEEIGTAELHQLEAASAEHGVRVVIVTGRDGMSRLRDLVVAGNRRQLADPAFVSELKSWIRFSSSSAIENGDGLYAPVTGNPSMPDFIGRIGFSLFFDATAEDEKCAAQMSSSAGVAIFLGDHANPRHWVKVGRAAERFMLTAASLGLATSFLNQPIEVPELRAELAALAGEPNLRPDLLIRFGRAAPMPYSPRRPVGSVMLPA